MGVFDAMPRDGEPITAEDLSQKLGVDRELLGKLKFCVPLRLLLQVTWLGGWVADYCVARKYAL